MSSCAICLDTLKDPVAIPCGASVPPAFIAFMKANYAILGHVYCHGCISGTVKATASASPRTIHCPTCREPVSTGIPVCVYSFTSTTADLFLFSHSRSFLCPSTSTPLCSSFFPPHLFEHSRSQPCTHRHRPRVKPHRRGRKGHRPASHGERSPTTELLCMARPRSHAHDSTLPAECPGASGKGPGTHVNVRT
jgi:hypothetical protein